MMSSDKLLLSGKTALVTGAGKGIGREVAISLARNGADICVSSRTLDDVGRLSEEISSFGVTALPVQVDVSKNEDVKTLAKKALSTFPSIDILVCAAGFPLLDGIWNARFHELRDEDFLKVFQVDVLGSFRVIKEFLPSMMKNRRGVIILFSSTPAIAGYNKGSPYTVAKAANLGLVKELASEYGEYGIRVYGIAPGNIKTDRTYNRLSDEEKKLLAEESPMKRWGEPREVGQVATILASDYTSFVNGQTVVVDGGTVMI